jgi:hypothetical protein
MSSQEKRAGISLAAVFALRMLGLFLILPVFAIYAKDLPSGNDVALVGMALGAYGLTQAFLQIAYGAASDRFGRKPVIVFGLLLFAIGSFVAAFRRRHLRRHRRPRAAGRRRHFGGGHGACRRPHARAAPDQGDGDDRLVDRLVFAVSMVGAPLLYAAIGMPGIFSLTGGLALLAIFVVLKGGPGGAGRAAPAGLAELRRSARNRQLLRLNFGVFALHLMLTAMWVLLPAAAGLDRRLPVAEHWKVYLPALLISFVIMVPAIIAAEKFGRMKLVFNTAMVLLLCRSGRFRPVCRRPLRPGLLADAVLRRLQHSRSDAAVADFAHRAAARQRRRAWRLQHHPGARPVPRRCARRRAGQVCLGPVPSGPVARCSPWSGCRCRLTMSCRRCAAAGRQPESLHPIIARFFAHHSGRQHGFGQQSDSRRQSGCRSGNPLPAERRRRLQHPDGDTDRRGDKAVRRAEGSIPSGTASSSSASWRKSPGQYLKKGSSVYVEGRIRTRKWQDKEGNERYTTEIVANEMKMLGSREGMGAPASANEAEYGGSMHRRRPVPLPAAARGGASQEDAQLRRHGRRHPVLALSGSRSALIIRRAV